MQHHLPVLEPNLNDPHVQPGILRQLLADVSCWLRRVLVSFFEHLHLAGGYGGAGTLVSIGAIYRKNDRLKTKKIQ